MAEQFCKCNPSLTDAGSASHLDAAMHKLATFQRISWRDAFGGLTGPATRMHQYRGLRTRMLHAALNGRNCGKHDSGNRGGE